MSITRLAWVNLIYNPLNTTLSLLLMAFGVGVISLLLILNNQVEQQLQNNLRGIDMVVGAKGSPLQLILSSLYHVDKPTGNINFNEAKKLTKNPMVDFSIPLSYGDSFNGFRIVGSTHKYSTLYNMYLSEGQLWNNSMEVVVGSVVAQVNNLSVGDKFYGTHGLSENGHLHESHNYTVTGIFEPSNSVIDKLILTDIKSVWDVHDTKTVKNKEHFSDHHVDNSVKHHHTEEQNYNTDVHVDDDFEITSMLVKFKSPVGLIQLPRKVNETTSMQAAIPVFEINRLTNLLGFGVQTINIIALIIILVSGLSIFISLYNSLKKRRYELALIRVYGANRLQLIKLVFIEGITLSLLGTFFGLLISRLSLYVMFSVVNQQQFLNNIKFSLILDELWMFLIALFIGMLASLIPAIIAYKTNIPKILSNA